MSRIPSAFISRFCWTLPCVLDLAAMEKASSSLIGEHDYSSFRGAGCSSTHQVRTVYGIEVAPLQEIAFMTAAIPGNFVKIRIEANAFLRHMVRNIVGTLVEVGRSKILPEDCGAILACRDRTKAGPTAPARGLFLEGITY